MTFRYLDFVANLNLANNKSDVSSALIQVPNKGLDGFLILDMVRFKVVEGSF